MIDSLQLTKNAQFYKIKNSVTDEMINSLMLISKSNKEEGAEDLAYVFREEVVIGDLSYRYSLQVYPSLRPVYFLNSDLIDRIHAYILLIEYKDYLVVLKKSTANINGELKNNFETVGPKQIMSIFDDNKVEIQKLNLRNMTIAERAIRSRSYEAKNLYGVLSTHNAGRAIPSLVKVRDGTALKTISVNSGRLVEASQRNTLYTIASWCIHQIEKISAGKSNKEFLEAFASNVALKDVLNECQPNSVLIETNTFEQQLKDESLYICLKNKKDNFRQLPNKVLLNLLADFEQIFELDASGKVNGRASSSIKKNEKSITLDFKGLQKLYIQGNGGEISLQSYLVKHKLFTVTFTNPEFMYFMGACYKDNVRTSEVESILKMLEPVKSFQAIKSEKGDFKKSMTNFSNDSMFSAVEKKAYIR